MLVLSRKTDERIQIGPNITITIVQVRGGSVRIGVEAPPEVRVLRSELTPTLAAGESTAPALRGALDKAARPSLPARSMRSRTALRPVRQGTWDPGIRAGARPLAASLRARRPASAEPAALVG